MKTAATFILSLVVVGSSSAQNVSSRRLVDLAVVTSKEGTFIGLSERETISLGQRLTLPYNFPDSSNTSGYREDRVKKINYLVGVQLGLIVKNNPKAKSYNKLRFGLSLGSFKIDNIGSISNVIPYRIDTIISSTDGSLVYVDSNRVHSVILKQSGINFRLAIDYLIYLKTRSRISGYVGIGTAFNQSFTNSLQANYTGSSFIGSNPYNAGGPTFRENIDMLATETTYELKNSSQLNLHFSLGVQGKLTKDGGLSMFIEFQPGLSANFQSELKSSVDRSWLSQLGLVYSFKRKRLKEPAKI